ncbi:MAG: hypothetical protein OEO19_18655 [Gammaproteobacteria bacterium]|nr:hypothetical protein [Gammaproteobacteria bacterium]MDH3450263.1 hypothetical protein [Gammaproteobacteria bacterium]
MSADICDASTTTQILSVSYRISNRVGVLGCVKTGTRDANRDADPASNITGEVYSVDFFHRFQGE